MPKVLQYGKRLLVEKFITGREFTVGMVNGQILPPLEIKPPEGTYNFRAKYESDKTVYECPPTNLDMDEYRAMSDLAAKTFKAFKCKGLGRVDMIRKKKGVYYILELNCNMDFRKISSFPMAAKAAGISFSELCQMIMSNAE